MKTFRWLTLKRRKAALLWCLGVGCVIPCAAQPGAPRKSSVEVVFVLDTTGSMGGLLEGAKQKIWGVANEIAKGKPAPKIKMGLVAYRDRGDEYVTKTFDLSSNLDKIYKELLSLKADGGGDTPEHVLKALEDSIERLSWSNDPKTFKVIYLVGDSPAHLNYGDTPGLEELARRAVAKRIIINTLLCGPSSDTAAQWTRLARLGEGKFLPIPQDGGVVAVSTPFDARLAELNSRLDATMLAYGRRKAEGQAEMALSMVVAGAAAPAAAADRAAFKAKAGFDSELDLAEAVEQKKADLKNMPRERQKKVAETLAERGRIREEIKELSLQRARAIEKEAKRPAKDSFDTRLVESLKEEASRSGIAY